MKHCIRKNQSKSYGKNNKITRKKLFKEIMQTNFSEQKTTQNFDYQIEVSVNTERIE